LKYILYFFFSTKYIKSDHCKYARMMNRKKLVKVCIKDSTFMLFLSSSSKFKWTFSIISITKVISSRK
jgi:hypothetical protein